MKSPRPRNSVPGGPEFHVALRPAQQEPDSLRGAEYGGEFGQRCLLSRRLVQAGVRFIEVSHNLNFMNRTEGRVP